MVKAAIIALALITASAAAIAPKAGAELLDSTTAEYHKDLYADVVATTSLEDIMARRPASKHPVSRDNDRVVRGHSEGGGGL